MAITYATLTKTLLPFLVICFVAIGVINRRYTLVFLITAILIHGFGVLTYLFVSPRPVVEQLNFVLVHFCASLMLFLFWLLDKHYRSVFNENKILKSTLTELEGYKNTGSILNYTHFLSHINYIQASTSRRGCKNHLLKIDVNEDTPNISSVEHVLLDSASKKLRNNFYDLITQRVKREVLIFLQDTTLAGCRQAINRLKADLQEKITLDTLPFTFSLYEVGDDDIETILETCTGKAT